MPKIIGSNLDEHREKTRYALFDALSALLREQSFESITMAQIARRAGVGRTAVYNHFDDKESLLFALMGTATEQFTTVISHALSHTDDPLARLAIYIRAQIELKQQFHLSEGINLRNLVRTQPAEKLRAHVRVIEHILAELLKEAHAAGVISAAPDPLTVTLIHSSLAGPHLPEEARERRRVITSVESYVLRALGADRDAIAGLDDALGDLDFASVVRVVGGASKHSLPPVEEAQASVARCPINVAI